MLNAPNAEVREEHSAHTCNKCLALDSEPLQNRLLSPHSLQPQQEDRLQHTLPPQWEDGYTGR